MYCENENCANFTPCKTHGKKLLILDLDHTLIHSIMSDDGHYITYYRPYVTDFLIEMQEIYDIMIWTAGMKDYALPIVEDLFDGLKPPVHVYTRDKCTRKYIRDGLMTGHTILIKKLSNIPKYSKHDKIIVDDTPETYCLNYGNAIPIDKWYKDDKDDETLLSLGRYLKNICDVVSVRSINKHHWMEY